MDRFGRQHAVLGFQVSANRRPMATVVMKMIPGTGAPVVSGYGSFAHLYPALEPSERVKTLV